MFGIQGYPDELDWVNAKMAESPESKSFVTTVCWVALRADPQNYEMFRDFLHQVMRKYPAKPDLLEAQRRDR